MNSSGAIAAAGPTALHHAFAAVLPAPGWAALSPGHAVVALLRLDDWRPWLAQALAMLDAAESARVQRRYFPRDREALALAYALHRMLLACALDCEATSVPLGRDRLGCPLLADGRACTSLSHSDGIAAFVVAATGPVGVDAEPRARARVMHEIAERVCHPSEAAALERLPAAARASALLALWVRKEAVLKAAGVGLAHEMSSFAAPAGILPLPAHDGRRTRVCMLDGGREWVAAVAVPEGVRVTQAWLRPQERR